MIAAGAGAGAGASPTRPTRQAGPLNKISLNMLLYNSLFPTGSAAGAPLSPNNPKLVALLQSEGGLKRLQTLATELKRSPSPMEISRASQIEAAIETVLLGEKEPDETIKAVAFATTSPSSAQPFPTFVGMVQNLPAAYAVPNSAGKSTIAAIERLVTGRALPAFKAVLENLQSSGGTFKKESLNPGELRVGTYANRQDESNVFRMKLCGKDARIYEVKFRVDDDSITTIESTKTQPNTTPLHFFEANFTKPLAFLAAIADLIKTMDELAPNPAYNKRK